MHFEPTLIPHPKSNSRKAKCIRCGINIPAGLGHGWEFHPDIQALTFGSSGRLYVCEECQPEQELMHQREPEMREALDRLRNWTRDNVNLGMGWQADHVISRTVYKAGGAGLDIARELEDTLPALPDYSYGAIVDETRRVAAYYQPSDQERSKT